MTTREPCAMLVDCYEHEDLKVRVEVFADALSTIREKCFDAFGVSWVYNDAAESHELFKELWDIAHRALMTREAKPE